MMTNSQAYAALERKEWRARQDGVSCSIYGNNALVVVHTPGHVDRHRYRWGMNYVERHTALRVVQTFEEGSRR